MQINSYQNQTFGQNSDDLCFVCALLKDDSGSSLTVIICHKNMLVNVKMLMLWKEVGLC